MTEPSSPFAPQATETMAQMFDQVSPRYRLLNRLMTLGQDQAWRKAMWAAVPERARVVLDLCTGDGSSLPGLRRPGRLVIGLDASLRMLELAAEADWRGGWAPRLVCGDAFRLPFRDHSIDAVTVAFGVRNLRPQAQALAELARVMRPGGVLVVLDATAPRRGLLAPPIRFYVRHVIPLLGRLSPDPSAYQYLADSILEFGGGESFTEGARALGFQQHGSRGFMFGATRLWVATSSEVAGEFPSTVPARMHAARMGESARGEMPSGVTGLASQQRGWNAVQFALSFALLAALCVALAMMLNPNISIPLDRPRRSLMFLLIWGGIVVFGGRAVMFLLRALRPGSRG